VRVERFLLEVLACLIVVVKEDPVFLNKDLDTGLGAIQIQENSCEFLQCKGSGENIMRI
jgi:hypothetical protein